MALSLTCLILSSSVPVQKQGGPKAAHEVLLKHWGVGLNYFGRMTLSTT
jgi:hypothetical protein